MPWTLRDIMATRAALNFSGRSTVQVVTERAERVIEWMHLILVSHMVTAPVSTVGYTLPFFQVSSVQLGSDRVCPSTFDHIRPLVWRVVVVYWAFQVLPCSRIDKVKYVVCISPHRTRDSLQTVRLCLFTCLMKIVYKIFVYLQSFITAMNQFVT